MDERRVTLCDCKKKGIARLQNLNFAKRGLYELLYTTKFWSEHLNKIRI